jgi:hypothetical protein
MSLLVYAVSTILGFITTSTTLHIFPSELFKKYFYHGPLEFCPYSLEFLIRFNYRNLLTAFLRDDQQLHVLQHLQIFFIEFFYQ